MCPARFPSPPSSRGRIRRYAADHRTVRQPELPEVVGPGPPPQCCMPGTMYRRTNESALALAHFRNDLVVVVHGVERRESRDHSSRDRGSACLRARERASGRGSRHRVRRPFYFRRLESAVHSEGFVVPVRLLVDHVREIADAEERHEALAGAGPVIQVPQPSTAFFSAGQISGEDGCGQR